MDVDSEVEKRVFLSFFALGEGAGLDWVFVRQSGKVWFVGLEFLYGGRWRKKRGSS